MDQPTTVASLGPGRYDDLAALVRTLTVADGVVVIVIGGDRGDGMSAHFAERLDAIEILKKVPTVLRALAGEIEHDVH